MLPATVALLVRQVVREATARPEWTLGEVAQAVADATGGRVDVQERGGRRLLVQVELSKDWSTTVVGLVAATDAQVPR